MSGSGEQPGVAQNRREEGLPAPLGAGAGSLHGLRVLDITAPHGQYCGKLLADLGADVIKIELPGGDRARQLGPFKNDRPDPEGSLFFAYYNTNKRSLSLDPTSAEGREAIRRLVISADALLETPTENSGPLGLSHEDLIALNPRLVITSLRGFSLGGPYSSYRSTDLVVFAMSGLMHAIGEPEGPPMAAPDQVPFDLAAVDAAIGTLLALRVSRQTGLGQCVSVAAHETLAAQINPRPADQVVTQRFGRLAPSLAPSGTYPCSDGAVEFTVLLPGQWEGLKILLGNPPELEGQEWLDRRYRMERAGQLADVIVRALADRAAAEIVLEAQRLRVPCGPVNTVASFAADPHVAARKFFVPAERDALGLHRMPGAPYRLSKAGWALRRPAPRLGEHTAEILEELRHAPAGPGVRPSSVSGHVPRHLPLEGIRVVTFSTAFAGPIASRYLADFGAEVIKVESRRRPDNTRTSSSAGVGSYREPTGVTTAPGFAHFNRNKLDLAIDLSQERGRDVIRRLIGMTDVVMENFSLRVLQGWGFDYEGLRAINPDIILLDMQGMGQSGPLRNFVTFGPTLHAYSGLTSLWGYTHSSFVDYVAAMHAVVAMLAALRHRERTGRGLHIDQAQLESAAAILGPAYLDYLVNGRVAEARHNRSPRGAPSGCYRCLGDDAWCAVDVTSDEDWRRLSRALGEPGLAHDARYATHAARATRLPELDELLEAWTRRYPPLEVEQRLQQAGVPAGAVRSVPELELDVHLRSRGFFVRIDHPVLGEWQYPGFSIQLSDTPGRVWRHAPLLGQDNEYVLSNVLGMSAEDIAGLEAEGILS